MCVIPGIVVAISDTETQTVAAIEDSEIVFVDGSH